MKTRRVRLAVLAALGGDEAEADRILGIVKAQQNDY
jgi:hypothetical protein